MVRKRGLISAWPSFTAIWEGRKFRRYLHRRGYRASTGWPFFRRAFLECWAERGFHRFWRAWNPGLGFLVFRPYRSEPSFIRTFLPGRGHRFYPAWLASCACGWIARMRRRCGTTSS